MRKLPSFFNLLKFFAADEYLDKMPVPGTEELRGPPTCDEILQFLCQGVSKDGDKVARRYREASVAGFQIAPGLDFFKDKIIEPLRQAQSNYILGNWLAAIALCGVVAEMLTMLMFDMVKSDLVINGKSLLDIDVQKAVLGKDFGKLPQEGRLKFLRSIDVISDETFKKLDRVRDTRNNYAHYYDYKATPATQRKQALGLLQDVAGIARDLVLTGWEAGAVVLHPQMETYLSRIGILKPEEE